MKRILGAAVALIIVLISVVSAAALDYGCTVEPLAEAVYLENLDTSTVVYQKSAGQRMYPASTTKIMTYVVVAESVSDLDNTMVAINDEVFSEMDPESTVMGLSDHVGESFSIRDLLYGMMLPSGNDAALVLADHVGGGISGFVDMMNAKASELGCKDTHFANPHGLYDVNHYTTAEDLATITKYAMNLQSFMDIANTVEYTPKGFDEPLHNTNYMLDPKAYNGQYYYQYTEGVKTGYLDEAGKCLVTTAVKDGYTYLCVELGTPYSFAEDINYAMLDAAKFYDWAFSGLSKQTVYGPGDTVKSVHVNFAPGDKDLAAIPEKEITALLPNDYDKDKVVIDINCVDSVDAPVTKGDVLGTVTVRYDDTQLGTTNVVASEDVKRSNFKYFTHRAREIVKGHVVLAIVIGVVILALIILIAVLISRSKRAKKRARARENARRRYRD